MLDKFTLQVKPKPGQASFIRYLFSEFRIASIRAANDLSMVSLFLIRFTPSLRVTTSRPNSLLISVKLPEPNSTASKPMTARASAGPRGRVPINQSEGLKPYSSQTTRVNGQAG